VGAVIGDHPIILFIIGAALVFLFFCAGACPTEALGRWERFWFEHTIVVLGIFGVGCMTTAVLIGIQWLRGFGR
jgi:hypothetical protein